MNRISFLVNSNILTTSRSNLSIKVFGSRSRSNEENVILYLTFASVCLFSTKTCSKDEGHLKDKIKVTQCQGHIKVKWKEINFLSIVCVFVIVQMVQMVHLRQKRIILCNLEIDFVCMKADKTSFLAMLALSAVQSSAHCKSYIHNAILSIDTSDNSWYNQVYRVIGTPYLSITANNVPNFTTKFNFDRLRAEYIMADLNRQIKHPGPVFFIFMQFTG